MKSVTSGSERISTRSESPCSLKRAFIIPSNLLAKLIYCCVKSACKREGVAFELDLLDFADQLDIESMSEVSKDLMDDAADAEDQKKTKNR